MATRVVGLIKLLDPLAFDEYRAQVGATIEAFNGRINFRGSVRAIPWNELGCEAFEAIVDIEFPDETSALAWANSPAYQQLLEIRSKAMKVTLFMAE